MDVNINYIFEHAFLNTKQKIDLKAGSACLVLFCA